MRERLDGWSAETKADYRSFCHFATLPTNKRLLGKPPSATDDILKVKSFT
jgi:hypothetical protein